MVLPAWPFGEVLSIDVLPCSSGEGCHLFGCGDHLGAGLGEAVTGSCYPTRGALAGEADGGDRGDHPSKMW